MSTVSQAVWKTQPCIKIERNSWGTWRKENFGFYLKKSLWSMYVKTKFNRSVQSYWFNCHFYVGTFDIMIATFFFFTISCMHDCFVFLSSLFFCFCFVHIGALITWPCARHWIAGMSLGLRECFPPASVKTGSITHSDSWMIPNWNYAFSRKAWGTVGYAQRWLFMGFTQSAGEIKGS